MKGWGFLLLVAALICSGVQKGGCFPGFTISQRFPLGAIGCLFTNQICQIDQECTDDHLFGTCQKRVGAKDFYQYILDRDTLEDLESEILVLINLGFSWRDPFTQCVLQNVLFAYRENIAYDRSKCFDLFKSSEDTESDIADVLETLFDNEDDASQEDSDEAKTSEDNYLPDYNSQKRDEFLKIHKYFAPSQSYWKRRSEQRPYEDADVENEVDNVIRAMDTGSLDYNDLTDDDVNKMQLYLQALQEVAQMYENNDNNELENSEEEEQYDLTGEGTPPVEGGGAFWTSPQIVYPDETSEEIDEQPLPGVDLSILKTDDESNNQDDDLQGSEETIDAPLTETINPDESQEEMDNRISGDGLTPRYAKLLADLLQDDLDPSSLSDKDLNQLTEIVNRLLDNLGNQEDTIDADVFDLKNDAYGNDALSEWPSSKDNNLGRPFGMNAEDMGSGEPPLQAPMIDNSLVKKSEASDTDEKPSDVSENAVSSVTDQPEALGVVDATYAFITVDKDITMEDGEKFLEAVARILQIPPSSFTVTKVKEKQVTFQMSPDLLEASNASSIIAAAGAHKDELSNWTGLMIVTAGIGKGDNKVQILKYNGNSPKFFVLTFVLCGCIAGVLIGVVVVYLVKRHSRSKDKLAQIATEAAGAEASQDYQDLCRQRMQSKTSEKPEPLHAAGRIGSVSESQVRSPSSRSSTSSWSEEPVTSNMDISTGHIVLSYMEDHLKNKDRLDQEWEALKAYEADPCSMIVASDPSNARKNRYSDNLPYDHSRVVLADASNVSGSDYINASTITDHDPRNPAYISTQGPLPHTVADFWQMVWEQGSVVVVMLTKLTENGVAMCHRYWPEEGSDLYHIYEVHLVSEHIWCDDYLVRSFYLKNLQTNETRTVTQFHFLTWQDNKVPGSVKALLDFRRKVNKSYRGRSCPIVVHCSDGSGRSGTYSLIDMVLNRLAKGAKEIDIAATLEHMRDQRMGMVKTKEQFEFVLAAVAEEVHAILKSLPQ